MSRNINSLQCVLIIMLILHKWDFAFCLCIFVLSIVRAFVSIRRHHPKICNSSTNAVFVEANAKSACTLAMHLEHNNTASGLCHPISFALSMLQNKLPDLGRRWSNEMAWYLLRRWWRQLYEHWQHKSALSVRCSSVQRSGLFRKCKCIASEAVCSRFPMCNVVAPLGRRPPVPVYCIRNGCASHDKQCRRQQQRWWPSMRFHFYVQRHQLTSVCFAANGDLLLFGENKKNTTRNVPPSHRNLEKYD